MAVENSSSEHEKKTWKYLEISSGNPRHSDSLSQHIFFLSFLSHISWESLHNRVPSQTRFSLHSDSCRARRHIKFYRIYCSNGEILIEKKTYEAYWGEESSPVFHFGLNYIGLNYTPISCCRRETREQAKKKVEEKVFV